MKTIEMTIYANYGLLAHEKRVIFSVAPLCDIADALRVVVPNVSDVNAIGDPIITLDGTDYLLGELLTSVNDKPALRWIANGIRRTQMLTIINA